MRRLVIAVMLFLPGCIAPESQIRDGIVKHDIFDYENRQRDVISIYCDGQWWAVFDRSRSK